jgi:SAM-dependent methyltransferase
VGTVANINPQKGIEYFIRSAGLIYRARPDTWFLISGATYETHISYRQRLDAEIIAAGLPPGRVVFSDEPSQQHYAALDVKLISSVVHSEGTTTTAPEAMACSVPVVAANVGAVDETIEHGVTGLLVPPRDPAVMAQATLRLLNDPELARELGAEGRRRAVGSFGVTLSLAAHQRAMRAALDSGRAPTARPEDRGSAWMDLLACPRCRTGLARADSRLTCGECGQAYPITRGVPVFSSGRKRPSFGDRCRAHMWGFGGRLTAERFRRAASGIEALLPGAVVVAASGTDGLDAERFAGRAARVIVVHEAVGDAAEAVEAARLRGHHLEAIVADIALLPFPDRGCDVVALHDVLGHLSQPNSAIAEAARVAGSAVTISEPAGVGALRGGQTSATLRQLADDGYLILGARQFFLPSWSALPARVRHLTNPILNEALWIAFRLVNAVAQRRGNRIAIRARRRAQGPFLRESPDVEAQVS